MGRDKMEALYKERTRKNIKKNRRGIHREGT